MKPEELPDKRRRKRKRRRKPVLPVLLALLVLLGIYPGLSFLLERGMLPGQAQKAVQTFLRILDGDERALVGSGSAPARDGLQQLPAETDGYLIVDIIDAGQGDAALIRQGEHVMFFDCGGEESAAACLNAEGIRHLEGIWFSHADADHLSGFDGITRQCRVDHVYRSPYVNEKDTWTYEKTMRLIAERHIPMSSPAVGEEYSLGDAKIRVLGPLSEDPEIENNHSLAVRLTYGDTSFLFCGDAQEEEEREIAQGAYDCRSDVLHVNHHGSNSSSSSLFLEKVQPRWAVISCGADNDYGHPGAYALGRLEKSGAEVLRTDRMGTVRFISDGSEIAVSCERNPEN